MVRTREKVDQLGAKLTRDETGDESLTLSMNCL